MPEFTLDYFIAKFESIPEDKWTTCGLYKENGRYCALGHCGMDKGLSMSKVPEAYALYKLTLGILGYSIITQVNDNTSIKFAVLGATPKQRVLAYLKQLKAQQ